MLSPDAISRTAADARISSRTDNLDIVPKEVFQDLRAFGDVVEDRTRAIPRGQWNDQGQTCICGDTRAGRKRMDSGRWIFSASEILGNGIVASVGDVYYPDERGLTSTLHRVGTKIGTDAVSQVLKEFWPDIKLKWLHRNSKYKAWI